MDLGLSGEGTHWQGPLARMARAQPKPPPPPAWKRLWLTEEELCNLRPRLYRLIEIRPHFERAAGMSERIWAAVHCGCRMCANKRLEEEREREQYMSDLHAEIDRRYMSEREWAAVRRRTAVLNS